MQHKNEKQYIRIYERLRDDIRSGLYPCGSKLPSKRTMAQDSGVSVITVEHAYQILCDEGYAAAKERSGYYAAYDESSSFPVAEGADAARVFKPNKAEEPAFPFSVYAKTARKVLSVYAEAVLLRSPDYGCPVLRDAIAAYLARSRRIAVKPEQIIIGAGAEYLYGLILQALGRDMIYGIESPSYEKIAKVYSANEIRCDMLPLGPDGINSEALANSPAQVLHISPYRSYPSGVTASAAKKREYLRWCEAKGACIIEDDFESEFTPARKPEDTLFSMAVCERVIYVNTFSNTVSPAIRTAYMLVPEALMKRFEDRIGFYTCTVPVFEQYILAELMMNGDFERHINRVRRKRRTLQP